MTKTSSLALLLGCALGLGASFASSFLFGARDPSTPATVKSADDAAARAREILGGRDPLPRIRDFSALLSTLDASAVPVVRDALEESPLDGGTPEVDTFAMWWAQHDPKAAMLWTKADWRARHGNVIASVVRSWAHSDPMGALGAARGLMFTPHRDLAVDAAIAGWDESGQPGLLQAIQKFGSIEFQRCSESYARRRVVALGPAGALAWVDSFPAGEFRQILAVRVASAAAAERRGAAIAAEWATPRVSSGKNRLSNFPRRIGTRWVRHDPEAAMAWLKSLPAGNDRDDGVGDAFRTWAQIDWAAARTWIENSEIETWNEPAHSVYAKAIASERPKEAIELSRRLPNSDWRESTTIIVGQIWFQNDPKAAREWLDHADLPEHTRKTAEMIPGSNEFTAEQRAQRRARMGAQAAEMEAEATLGR